MPQEDGSVLFIHHRDLASPIGTTHAYYLSSVLSESHDVDVICRRRAEERSTVSENNANLHDLYTGEIPLLSGLLFQLLSTLYAIVLALRNEYAVTYCSQSSMIQGWVGSRVSGSSYVISLASVPVRQTQDFRNTSGTDLSIRQRATMLLLSLYARVIHHLIERATVVVSLTEGIADVTERVYGVDLSDDPVIGMGVDVESFSVPRTSGGGDGTEDEWTITYIGAVHATRDLDVVLEAMADLDVDLTFRIAGQGPDGTVESLMADAEQLGVADQVEWLGFVPHEEIPRLLAASEFTVSPLPDIESYRISYPAKLLEYMAAGTLVVASDIRPHRKLITDGTNGFLYDGSAEHLAETIEEAVHSLEDHSEIRRQARRTAEAHDWEVIVEEYRRAVFGESASNDGESAAAPNLFADGRDSTEP